MSAADDAQRLYDTPSESTASDSGHVSYVYPVRSLLSGIRPSASQKTMVSDESKQAAPVAKATNETTARASHELRRMEPLQRSISSRDASPTSPAMTPTSESMYPDTSGGDARPLHRRRKHRSAVFRDFSPEENPLSPRIFSTVTGSYFPPLLSDAPQPVIYTSGPTGEPVTYTATEDEDGDELVNRLLEYQARHPPQFSQAASQAFAEATALLSTPLDGQSGYDAALHSHFSHTGIVHLPPRGKSSAPSSLSSRSMASASRGRTSRSSGSGSDSPNPQVLQEELSVVQMPSTQDHPRAVSVIDSNETGSGSSLSGSSDSEGAPLAFQYQHVEDDHGHHLIIGREGKISRCEDEPIRTPGAVQGFGILIAVEEIEETGNLVVRQVSENSAELLGLSPTHLFSLECFSETLPEQQSDILFDNIQYLNDTSLSPEEQAENVHVFLLSGWGESGTALVNTRSNDPQQRRSWTCWCAAHRPQMTAPANMASNGQGSSTRSGTNYRNLIVLEFELERDTFNPLYPPLLSDDGISFNSGISSPSEGSASTNSTRSTTDSSGRTLVSSASSEEHLMTPDDSTSSLGPSDPSVVTSSHPGTSPSPFQESSAFGVHVQDDWMPSPEDILESTTSRAKPLLALERLRRQRRPAVADTDSPSGGSPGARRSASRRRRGTGAVGMMDVFAVMAQINEQLGAAPDLDTFLKVVAGVIKDLTQFHRVLVYQFDESWNGKVVAELVDWKQTHELYRGLHFPATDIPAQARHLYALNKVRLLYDRGQPSARLVVRSKDDLETPLDMTHCYLRAMSPIHIKYLENMGVRASMSVSIVAFGNLWGLVACHSYGPHGTRVSFPVRQMLRLLSQSISRNIERLSYAQRFHTRKLINTTSSEQHPSGYIVSNADDLLGLFDADYGVLVIGEGAKILGPNQHGQEILIVAEYLRLKQFDTIQVSQAVTQDYPDLQLTTGLEVIAGLLYVPLSAGGRDFIAFLRKGQPKQVRWAGRPYKDEEQQDTLEPRTSFRVWSQIVAGHSRAWSDDHLETAGVLALVYGKFIEVWRQKESALQTTKLTNLLLSNASHEVRTPLNHIINYLELALNGSLDTETRENLSQSHAASKCLLFTINDLLDLTRLESGNETSFNEAFNLHRAIEDAVMLYRNEAARRGLRFNLDVSSCPKMVVGDARKIRTVVANLTGNALKYTERGSISVECRTFEEPMGLRSSENVAVEIIVSDTGCGISADKLECIFREFEQVESASQKAPAQGLGLGLAVVARIVEQLGGQLRVDSNVNEGSRFSFLIPFALDVEHSGQSLPSGSISSENSHRQSRDSSEAARDGHFDNLVEALSSHHLGSQQDNSTGDRSGTYLADVYYSSLPESDKLHLTGSSTPSLSSTSDVLSASQFFLAGSPNLLQTPEHQPSVVSIKQSGETHTSPQGKSSNRRSGHSGTRSAASRSTRSDSSYTSKLRLLIVEDNDINRMILAKRLSLDGHNVVNTTNGLEGVEMLESDWDFDCVLMDLQMPLLNGFEATERIRLMEQTRGGELQRASHKLNGRIPIFAVSASLFENQREELFKLGFDGWILKPIDFKRLKTILRGVVDATQRGRDVYHPACSWEVGGWLRKLNKASEEL